MSDLVARAGACAAGLEGAVLEHPFGEETDVYKVAGKIFVVIGDSGITLKAEPPLIDSLVESEPAVDRGYHMNKRHWITIDPAIEIDPVLVCNLVEDAHALVAG